MGRLDLFATKFGGPHSWPARRDGWSKASNLTWAGAPGNTLLSTKATRLPKDSVVNVSQIITLDRALLTERVARLAPKHLGQILHGIDIVLGR
jgi:mRNA interferase MazF